MEYRRSEVAKIIGVSLSTIKNYDTWHLVSPKRDKNNYRVYTEDDLEKLREITLFRQLGMEVERDIIPLMKEGNYDREKVLSLQIKKLNETKREIEKSIRLASLIRAIGLDALSLKDSEKPAKDNVSQALDIMGNPIFDQLFIRIDSMTEEETEAYNSTFQLVLDQFQLLLKNNTSPDDPKAGGILRILIDANLSLAPSFLQDKLKNCYHALVLYYTAIFSSDTIYKQQADASYGPALSEYIADCCLAQYTDDWMEDSEDLLELSLRDLSSTPQNVLSDPLLNQWDELLHEYLGTFNPAFISAEEYLSLSKELLLDGYEPSEMFTAYIDRLFEILAENLKTKGEILT